MSSPLIRLPEKFQRQEEALPEHLIMMPWVHKPDLSTALKVKLKRERKLFILLLFMRSMSSTHVRKDFWHSFLVLLVKSLKKLENKLTKR